MAFWYRNLEIRDGLSAKHLARWKEKGVSCEYSFRGLVRPIVPWCSQDPAEFVGEACVGFVVVVQRSVGG
jgi:hypothetical protein